jgi:hypothetical protein
MIFRRAVVALLVVAGVLYATGVSFAKTLAPLRVATTPIASFPAQDVIVSRAR